MEEIPLQGDALGPQEAGHAADVTGRRVIGCPESPSFTLHLDVEWNEIEMRYSKCLCWRLRYKGHACRGAGVEPTCSRTFVSPARAVPPASAPFRSISKCSVEIKFNCH